MSDREIIVRKESNRYRILKLFYDELGDNRYSGIDFTDVLNHFVHEQEMSAQEAESALNYLLDEALLESVALGGETSITHLGVKEIEASIRYPDRSTSHFSEQAIKVVIQEVIMGDKFEKISDSTIINRSSVDNAFNVSTSEHTKTIAETAVEIQELLTQLEKINAATTEAEQITYVNIATKPELKQRAISALKEGGNTAIDEFIVDNKYLKVVKAIIQGWLQSNG
jgi:hypothetical protein